MSGKITELSVINPVIECSGSVDLWTCTSNTFWNSVRQNCAIFSSASRPREIGLTLNELPSLHRSRYDISVCKIRNINIMFRNHSPYDEEIVISTKRLNFLQPIAKKERKKEIDPNLSYESIVN